MSLESELQIITEYVEEYRVRYHITPTSGVKSELSCLAFGEGYNLLYCQLITTLNGGGYWSCMHDQEIRQLVLDEITKSQKRYPAKGK